MKLDLTGVVDDGGFVVLNPGRYSVVTKDEWSAKKSQAGNPVLRIPFTVQDKGEYEGATSSYFHTLMMEGPAEKLRQNKLFTVRLLTSLGILSEDDRGPKGELGIEFEFGDKDDRDNVPLYSIIVNGERRALGGKTATAVVVVDNNTQSGISVKQLEANGKPVVTSAGTPAVTPQPTASAPKATGGFPF